MENKNDRGLELFENHVAALALKFSYIGPAIQSTTGATPEEKFVNYFKKHCDGIHKRSKSEKANGYVISSVVRILVSFLKETDKADYAKKLFLDIIPRNVIIMVILQSKIFTFKGDDTLKHIEVEITREEIRQLFHATNDQLWEQLLM